MVFFVDSVKTIDQLQVAVWPVFCIIFSLCEQKQNWLCFSFVICIVCSVMWIFAYPKMKYENQTHYSRINWMLVLLNRYKSTSIETICEHWLKWQNLPKSTETKTQTRKVSNIPAIMHFHLRIDNNSCWTIPFVCVAFFYLPSVFKLTGWLIRFERFSDSKQRCLMYKQLNLAYKCDGFIFFLFNCLMESTPYSFVVSLYFCCLKCIVHLIIITTVTTSIVI